MARLDYQAPYTLCPAQPSPAYPTRTEVWVPFVEIALLRPNGTGFKTLALLDTGATVNLFHSDFADALRLDWKAGATLPIRGISGTVSAHVLPVRLEICGAHYSWQADIAFSPELPRDLPLLGHYGFFEHFEVRFKTGSCQYRIHLK